MEIKILSALCFIALTTIGSLIFCANSVLGAPIIHVSPNCGPADPGFNIIVNSNGFSPNSNVDWKLVDSHNQIPLYGYFQTNSTGGFNDVTFADDVKPDRYRMVFGTDANNDNKFDQGAPIVLTNITIPCP